MGAQRPVEKQKTKGARMTTIALLGAGAMSASLTVPLTDRGHEVRLWATPYDEAVFAALQLGEPHPALQEPVPAEVKLYGPDQLEAALEKVDCVILGVSCAGIQPTLEACAPFLDSTIPLVTVAKGFIELQGKPVTAGAATDQLLELLLGEPPPTVSLAGPSIADELIRRMPTVIAAAGRDFKTTKRVCDLISTDYLILHPQKDRIGLDICAAYKNIYALALAWPEGLQERCCETTNFKAILFMNALQELRLLVEAAEGDVRSVIDYAGLGDLITTTGAGRNGRFGRLLGAGQSVTAALSIMKDEGIATIEGFEAARPGIARARQLTDPHLRRLPLLRAIHHVLFEAGTVEALLRDRRLLQHH
jgi:glycerol-3-phosphate dehydrogenase (NAD(P)+)